MPKSIDYTSSKPDFNQVQSNFLRNRSLWTPDSELALPYAKEEGQDSLHGVWEHLDEHV